MSVRQMSWAVVLLIGLPMVVVAPPAALVVVAVRLQMRPLNVTTCLVVAVWACLSIQLLLDLWCAAREAAMRAAAPLGVDMSRQEAPGLWRMADEVAGTGVVDRILIDDSAALSIVCRRGRLCLVVGLPLLAALTPSQLRALLAARLRVEGPLVRVLRAAGRGLDGIWRSADPMWGALLGRWRALYDRACPPEGDPGPLSERLAGVDRDWEHLRNRYVRRYFRPAGMRAPVGEGLAAMRQAVSGNSSASGRPTGYGLLADPGRTEGLVMGCSDLPLRPWAQVIAAAGANRRRWQVERACDELVEGWEIEEATPRSILGVQETFYGLQETEGEDGPEYVELTVWLDPDLLCTVVEEVLMACGRVRLVDDWGAEPGLRGPDGPFDASTMVGEATAARIGALIPVLESWGADLDRPYGPSQDHRDADEVVAAIGGTRLGYNDNVPRDVWLMPAGLLIVAGCGPAIPLRWRWRGGSSARIRRMHDGIGVERLRRLPGSIWVPQDRIEEVNLRGLDLRIRERGRRRRIALLHIWQTVELGSLWDAAVELYPGRVTTGRNRVPVPDCRDWHPSTDDLHVRPADRP